MICALSFTVTACITAYTPINDLIKLMPGQSQIFTVVSDDPTAELVWYLDDRKAATDTDSYTFNAEGNSSNQIIRHTLVVQEEGGAFNVGGSPIVFHRPSHGPSRWHPNPVIWMRMETGLGILQK